MSVGFLGEKVPKTLPGFEKPGRLLYGFEGQFQHVHFGHFERIRVFYHFCHFDKNDKNYIFIKFAIFNINFLINFQEFVKKSVNLYKLSIFIKKIFCNNEFKNWMF